MLKKKKKTVLHVTNIAYDGCSALINICNIIKHEINNLAIKWTETCYNSHADKNWRGIYLKLGNRNLNQFDKNLNGVSDMKRNENDFLQCEVL